MTKQYGIYSPSHDESKLDRTNYVIEADEWASINDIWEQERSHFAPGRTVTVQDLGTMEYKVYGLH